MTEPALKLHVPSPDKRPGDEAEFADLFIPAAGAVARPPVDAADEALRELPFTLIRVLDMEGQAHGEWAPDLQPDLLVSGLKTMLLTRAFDARMMKMQRTKRLSFYMKSIGEEAVATAAVMALRDEDMLFPSYRQQSGLIARGADIEEMMCQCISNSRDPLLGRQLPVHYTDAGRNWFSISGNLGTQFPQAVGWAMASAYKGDSAVACSWIGDGTSAEGDFHGAMTLASTYKAPAILNVVNNQWGISTHEGIARGQAASFAAKAIGYGLPGLRVDGNDFLAVYAATQWAAERARAGHGATLIETYTYRGEAHSTSDDPSKYRPKDEWKAWPLGDPVDRLKQHLEVEGHWTAEAHADFEAEAKDKVTAAWRSAIAAGTLEEGPLSPTHTMFEGVYAEQPWHIRRQRQALGV